ncbi:MAG: DNA helicase UvrD [Betaproteobacteria bacterium]|nr:MAG: DNA helicase UvrD [Betaproteobacteria bacterium]
MSNATHIPDFADRSRALDPACSFIVQAPAGSGKTGLLIQRYLVLLAHVDAPEEIVVITFTNKAVAEIRERVLTALAQTDNIFKTEQEKLICKLAGAVLQRDAQAGWQIVKNPTRLRIQTIDSLCASLTRQMPILSEFGFQLESIEDASDLYLEAARATIDLVRKNKVVMQDVERLLEHLDNDVTRIEKLLSKILEQRDHWLRHIHKGKDREVLEVGLKNVRHEALKRISCIYPESMQDELIKLARYAATNLKDSGSNSPLVTCEKLSTLPGSEEHDVPLWRGIAELLTKEDGDWRAKHNVSNGFPLGKTKDEKEKAKLWRGRALTLISKLKENDTLLQGLHDLRVLPPPTYTDTQWEVLGSITRLLPHAVAQLKLVFQTQGKVDFTEVAQGALRALGKPDAPTDLALALDYRIRHLLIDEFQDTSISQYELIAKLTAGWELGDGRTLFVVGDPMQSIYRFREAEVGLFLRARAEGIGSVALEPIILHANFRSQRGIVNWVNNTFVQIMPVKEEDIPAGAVSYTKSVATYEVLAGNAVSVHPFFNKDHAAEAAKVVEIVEQAQRDDPSATVAILVRNRAHLRDEILPQLREAGLRFRAIGIEELGHRPVVQDLLALTRALAHLADRLAWLAVLRAPWCGLILADFHVLVSKQTAHVPNAANGAENSVKEGIQTVWEMLNDEARILAVSTDGAARLLRMREVLSNCIDNRNRQSLRTTVEAAWLSLGGPACVKDATDIEDAETYFDYLEEHEEAGGISELAAFEKGLAKLYALPDLEANNTLQIMTIHKSKGLEFDYVIIPGLGRPPPSSEKKLFMWMEHHADLLFAPIQETGADSDLIYSWLEKLDREKEHFEDERLLYVAATRAKKFLHLLGNTGLSSDIDGVIEPKLPAGKSLLSKLWPVVQPFFAEAVSQEKFLNTSLHDRKEIGEEGERSIDQSQRLRRLASGWVLPSAPSRVKWRRPQDTVRTQEIEFSWAGETARHIGSVVHRWLQHIAKDEVIGWDMVRVEGLRNTFKQNLIACGMSGSDSDMESAVACITTALIHTVSDTRGQWLLGPQQDAQNELRMTTIIDGELMNLVIDRTFHSMDGHRWIVDYKTSSHEGADLEFFLDREQERYRVQLNRYAALMRKIDDQPIKLGLYFPLLKGWREWADDG